jgi:mRNA-degrading endonuclease YafQ of YafQ-DinJ toxin-antitoxin module
MKRTLLRSPAFIRAAKKLLRKNPQFEDDLRSALLLLANDAYDPFLRTHKLTGVLKGSWACSAGYDLRIIFCFVKNEGREAILLETTGTHDEVY